MVKMSLLRSIVSTVLLGAGGAAVMLAGPDAVSHILNSISYLKLIEMYRMMGCAASSDA